jgi:hypothetical protein
MGVLSDHSRLIGALIEAAPFEVLAGLSFTATPGGGLAVNVQHEEGGLIHNTGVLVDRQSIARFGPEFLARKTFDRIAAETMAGAV